ncbi:MAG TPA: hypothetical protein VFT84_14445, partial [Gemmatimonadales bacterium]|nr:hypothetical protein [Gemmatimonadales bacterium]
MVGTAVGRAPDGRASVKVFARTTGVTGVPAALDGIPVEIVVTGEIRALPATPAAPETEALATKWRFDRPVPIGVSTGNERA